MAQITETGYKIQTMTEWFEEIKQMYLDIDVNWQLDPSTPDGLMMATLAEIFTNLDELGQSTYNSKDPSKAKGLQLDTLTYLTTGSPRKLGTASTVTMRLTGLSGTVVDKKSEFKSTVDGTIWATNEVCIIPNEGQIDTVASCQTLGAISADADTITTIVSPIAGLTEATNTVEGAQSLGTPAETDAQLRERRQKSVATTGSNQVDNMYSVIATLPNVGEVKIYENYTNTTDAAGISAHSIAIIVRGGDEQEIADAIYSKKNPGCGLAFVGSDAQYHVTKTVTSEETGNQLTVYFNRPEPIDIFITIAISNDGTLPTNASTLIAQSIIDYAAGLTEFVTGFRSGGFNIGDNVIYSSLFTPINQVLGQFGSSAVTQLLIGKVQGSQAETSITIQPFELAQFETGNFSITIT